MTADVTVCIPAYKAERFVAAAIESVLMQSYRDIRILISVDPAGDGTEAVCARYAGDPRVTLNVNSERLGWVGNTNWCLDRIDTPFFAMCFHDDAMHPDFVLKTRQALLVAPGAVSAFGHMRRVGDVDDVLKPTEVTGTAFDTARAQLLNHQPAYGFKTLLRSGLVRGGLRLPEIGPPGYRADMPFILAHSLAGDFVVVPEVLYTKSFSAGTTTSGWKRMSADELLGYEAQVRAHMIGQIARAGLTAPEKLRLIDLITSAKAPPELRRPGAPDDIEDRLASLTAARLAGVPLAAAGAGPEDAGTAAFKARHLAERATRHLADGDPVGALHHARRALDHDPDNRRALSTAAHANMRLATAGPAARWRAVRDHATRMSEVNPQDAQAWALLAHAAFQLGAPKAALRHARRALACGTPQADQMRGLIARIADG